MALCPFRKKTTTEIHVPSDGLLNRYSEAEEEFLPCYEEDCSAWSPSRNDCKLINK